MEWLKAHDYLAVWLTLPIMLGVAIFQSYGTNKMTVSLSRFTVYLGFLACLAAAFTPVIDDGARMFAGAMAFLMLGFIALDDERPTK